VTVASTPCRGFLRFLASEACKLVSQAPHQIDEGDDKQERPCDLNEPETERDSILNENDERVIDRGRRKSDRRELRCG